LGAGLGSQNLGCGCGVENTSAEGVGCGFWGFRVWIFEVLGLRFGVFLGVGLENGVEGFRVYGKGIGTSISEGERGYLRARMDLGPALPRLHQSLTPHALP